MKTVLTVFSIFLAIGFSNSSFAASRKVEEKRLMVEPAFEAPWGKLFNEDDYLSGNSPLNQYTNVIVINKAKDKQYLRMYTNRQLMLKTKVSTGLEDVEYISWFKGIAHMFSKGTTQSHWRHTTRGFYTVKRIEGFNYRSGESRFQMPYAMFFNAINGLAIHQVPPDLSGGEKAGEAMLGKRASSGCVRVHKNVIQQIHSLVVGADKGEVPVINTRTGRHEVDQYGKSKYHVGYKTIVIVEEY